MLDNLRGALGLLTILPTGANARPDKGMVAFFPIVGLVLGLAWAGFDALAATIFPSLARAVLDVLFLAVLTGGLHLDGLADAADGLLAHRGRERALAIMRDSRTGVWGVLALVFAIALKIAAVYALAGPGRIAAVLVFVPALARIGQVAAMRTLPYGRGEDGMAHGLFPDKGWPVFSSSIAVVVLALVFLRPGAFTALACLAAVLFIVLSWYKKAMGCVTGDMLGALTEIIETALLLALAATLA